MKLTAIKIHISAHVTAAALAVPYYMESVGVFPRSKFSIAFERAAGVSVVTFPLFMLSAMIILAAREPRNNIQRRVFMLFELLMYSLAIAMTSPGYL